MTLWVRICVALSIWTVLAWVIGCTPANVVAKENPVDDTDTGSDTGSDSDTDSDGDSDTDTGNVNYGPPIPETCEEAEVSNTSVGCEFYAVDLDNWDDEFSPSADPLTFSVVVSNPQEDQDAEVVLEDGHGELLVATTLSPGQLEVIDVACEGGGCLVPAAEVNIQGIGERSAFRLTADVPITVYQWNTYGYEVFSTDASLLLPVTSLSGTYIAASWETADYLLNTKTSQVTVVATVDGTSLTITPAVDVSEYGGIGPLVAGVESAPITLNAADVLTIRAVEGDTDLTGTVIQADQAVAVFGAHSCANVPSWNYCCCDHLEEQLLPLEAWGTSTVLARHAPRADCSALEDAVLWRIIAGTDEMTVFFNPPAPSPYLGLHHFNQQGDYIEFLSSVDHFVEGLFDDPEDPDEPEAPFFAYQLMSSAYKPLCGPEQDEGDPMMLLSPPAGQYLDRYVFNTDDVFDFRYDHIIVVRPAGVAVDLDCLGELDDVEFTSVGSSGWEVGRFFIDDPLDSNTCVDGAHSISSNEPFGLSVVGTGDHQSYGYPGGIGVRAINPDPVIE